MQQCVMRNTAISFLEIYFYVNIRDWIDVFCLKQKQLSECMYFSFRIRNQNVMPVHDSSNIICRKISISYSDCLIINSLCRNKVIPAKWSF